MDETKRNETENGRVRKNDNWERVRQFRGGEELKEIDVVLHEIMLKCRTKPEADSDGREVVTKCSLKVEDNKKSRSGQSTKEESNHSDNTRTKEKREKGK